MVNKYGEVREINLLPPSQWDCIMDNIPALSAHSGASNWSPDRDNSAPTC